MTIATHYKRNVQPLPREPRLAFMNAEGDNLDIMAAMFNLKRKRAGTGRGTIFETDLSFRIRILLHLRHHANSENFIPITMFELWGVMFDLDPADVGAMGAIQWSELFERCLDQVK